VEQQRFAFKYLVIIFFPVRMILPARMNPFASPTRLFWRELIWLTTGLSIITNQKGGIN
jgi:hypothetical protein